MVLADIADRNVIFTETEWERAIQAGWNLFPKAVVPAQSLKQNLVKFQEIFLVVIIHSNHKKNKNEDPGSYK